jgi:hypothetical protein
MAHVARCHTEGCHSHAAALCSRCEAPVCDEHNTINDVCFECVLGMNSAAEGASTFDPAIIWWMD